MSSYRARVRLGAYSWTLDHDPDAPPVSTPAGPVVLDGLAMRWGMEGDEWPAQLEPFTAQLRILVRHTDQLAKLAINDVALVQLLDPAGGQVVASVYGRVAEASAEPVRRRVAGAEEVWTVYAVSITDHTATSNHPITVTLPAQTYAERWLSLAAAVPAVPVTYGPGFGYYAAHAPKPLLAEQLTEAGLVDTLRAQLRQAVQRAIVTQTTDWDPVTFILAPVADPTTGELVQLASLTVRPRPGLDELPAQLVVDAGGVLRLARVEPDWPGDAALGLPAGEVELAGAWRLNRARGTTAVRVKSPAQTVTVKRADYRADRAVVRDVDTTLALASDMRRLGEVYLPDVAPASAWDRDVFGWRVPEVGRLAGWWPDLSSANLPTPSGDPSRDGLFLLAPEVFQAPVAVLGTAKAHRFGAGVAYAGRVAGMALSVAGGQLRAEVTVWRATPAPPLPDTPASAGVTWAQLRALGRPLDPDMTYADLRLVRRPAS